jgi:DNA-binding NtrC family response regulator
MAKILVLHEDPVIRAHLSAILEAEGHKTVMCASIDEAKQNEQDIDLFLCGQLGKYSDGLLYAAEKAMSNRRVLIVGEYVKFTRIPFLDTNTLTRREAVVRVVGEALAGD